VFVIFLLPVFIVFLAPGFSSFLAIFENGLGALFAGCDYS